MAIHKLGLNSFSHITVKSYLIYSMQQTLTLIMKKHWTASQETQIYIHFLLVRLQTKWVIWALFSLISKMGTMTVIPQGQY